MQWHIWKDNSRITIGYVLVETGCARRSEGRVVLTENIAGKGKSTGNTAIGMKLIFSHHLSLLFNKTKNQGHDGVGSYRRLLKLVIISY